MAVDVNKRNENELLSKKEIMEDLYELTKAVSTLNKALLKLQNKLSDDGKSNAHNMPHVVH